ncbi:TlyA family RNA methyltransferase [Fulvimarina endophytica]|uniref:TlyA family RNA methyltransferase n=1 Tax=Fulvimarina endophytica TaxID=2293836 RepID=A0A371X5L3_9HYPH|nr:TlyA family RNA methyltransferase [Fulvimarina endophytica]RFC64334.1 TlyA family RNA methyltransferase [Fulvimarina endophytica]
MAMTEDDARMRLDALMTERGIVQTRARARDAILRGHVLVDGAVTKKPGLRVEADCRIDLTDPAASYVSRAALKLIAGLDAFDIEAEDRLCLDIGASTGGFSQVLLERGAARVVAFDVGHDQMHASLLGEERLTNVEGLNARDLTSEDLDGMVPELLVADVSFISLRLALPPALDLAAGGARGLFLIKPQFEAGREAIGKGGLLKDPASAEAVAKSLGEWLAEQPGWRVDGMIPSPISGGDGNREFILAATKAGPDAGTSPNAEDGA